MSIARRDENRERSAGPPRAEHATPPVAIDLAADDGDRSLIRWMLSLTPTERLGMVQRWAALVSRGERADG